MYTFDGGERTDKFEAHSDNDVLILLDCTPDQVFKIKFENIFLYKKFKSTGYLHIVHFSQFESRKFTTLLSPTQFNVIFSNFFKWKEIVEYYFRKMDVFSMHLVSYTMFLVSYTTIVAA